MRFSVWSSVLCSSDLVIAGLQLIDLGDDPVLRRAHDSVSEVEARTFERRLRLGERGLAIDGRIDAARQLRGDALVRLSCVENRAAGVLGREHGQIGKASGRERVCRYV